MDGNDGIGGNGNRAAVIDGGGGRGANNTAGRAHLPREVGPTFRRICMVVSPNKMRSCLEGMSERGRDVGLLGMKFYQCRRNFQAHVRWMQWGSKAERMGVQVGDVVSMSRCMRCSPPHHRTCLVCFWSCTTSS